MRKNTPEERNFETPYVIGGVIVFIGMMVSICLEGSCVASARIKPEVEIQRNVRTVIDPTIKDN